MKLGSASIFYWFHKKYPKSEHLHYDEKQGLMVSNPMFLEKNADISGHVVVMQHSQSEQFVHLPKGVLPIIVGKGDYSITQSHKERIVLEENVSLGEVFNTLQMIFERFYNWFEDL